MVEVTTHNFLWFKRKEVWFYKGGPVNEEAYTVFSVSSLPCTGNCRFHEKYQTSVIDLSKTETELFNAIHPTYRYDIRAAQKKGLKSSLFPSLTASDCLELIKGYNLFAAEKKIPNINERLLKALQKKGNILFSKVFYENADVATHIYIFDSETISLFSSFHNVNFSDIKIRSEANKLLHWEDITYAKRNEFKKYDWGGVNPAKLPGVSKFKMNFGGETVENFRYIKTSNLIYRIIKLFKRNNGQ